MQTTCHSSLQVKHHCCPQNKKLRGTAASKNIICFGGMSWETLQMAQHGEFPKKSVGNTIRRSPFSSGREQGCLCPPVTQNPQWNTELRSWITPNSSLCLSLLPAASALQTPPEPQQHVSDTPAPPLSAGTALMVEKGDILLVLLAVEQLLVVETRGRCRFACGACRERFSGQIQR